MDNGIQGHMDNEIPRRIWTMGYQDIWTMGYKDIWTMGYKDI